ncbi:MAG: NUDIX hydrolase [Candidatus Woesearchaeota archaeon]
MKSRIRVGALIFKDNKILLVKHVHPETGYIWWVPPGGGLQDEETIYDCAKREAFEETGLKIKTGNLAYLRQFIYREFKQNNMDVYIVAEIESGTETIKNIYGKGDDEHFIKEVGYFSKEAIQEINVFPEILKTWLWEDRETGFKNIRFIGVEYDKS